jgi:hypothetical protein
MDQRGKGQSCCLKRIKDKNLVDNTEEENGGAALPAVFIGSKTF